MTDSYHFQIEPEPRAMSMSDHIAYIERKDRERLNQLFDSYYARQAKVLNPLTRTAADVARQSIGPFPSGATLKVAGDKITGRIAPEPIRPALDWDTATPFDPFGADFIVTKGEVPTAPLHTSPTTDSAYPAIAGLLRG